MDLFDTFYSKLDITAIRTTAPPELIFLCGGGVSNGSSATFFRPKILEKLKNDGHSVILPEEITESWSAGQRFSKDLLELEKYFAALVSVIPLVCESFGSVAELGAFVNDDAIRNKLFVIIQEQYYQGNNAKSFIRLGPIQHYEEKVNRKAFCISDTPPSKRELDELCKKITSCKPKTTKCDFKQGYYRILFLIDLINIFVIAESKELKKTARRVFEKNKDYFFKFEPNELDEMLWVLEVLGLIRVRTKGQNKFYFIIKQRFFLKYSYKDRLRERRTFSDVGDVRKKILTDLYDNQGQIKRAKIEILKEEDEKGNIDWFSQDRAISQENIEKVLKDAPMHYKIFYIKKGGNRGVREIAQPTPLLKKIQRSKVTELTKLNKFLIHNAAKAYIKGKNGILENAKVHKNSDFFYKFDFRDFFHSIKAYHLSIFFRNHEIEEALIFDYLKFFCMFDKKKTTDTRKMYQIFNENVNSNTFKAMTEDFKSKCRLSVGAPSSPFLTNIIMYEFDEKISVWADKNNLKYSRYADDLTFSSKTQFDIKRLEKNILKVKKEIKYLDLKLNRTKTKFFKFPSRITITGLTITQDHKVSLGRKRKKHIRAMVHYFINNKLAFEQKYHLQGWLAFCKDVEPTFMKALEKKYGKENINKIVTFSGIG